MRARPADQVNDFLVYADGSLIGYAALDVMGRHGESTGMVAPHFRRRGIGGRLLAAVLAECRRRDIEQLLLVCEHSSASGNAFVAAQGERLRFDSSEYHLDLYADQRRSPRAPDILTLRPASMADADALTAIQAQAFGDPLDRSREDVLRRLTEPDSRCYAAERDGAAVGMVGTIPDEGGLYIRALGVLPKHQRRGYGRAILAAIVAEGLAEGYTRLSLDVATDNENALGLYQSCGFVVSNRYDYFVVAS
jgi:ribosomal protein S18 acetylase RimI-like enzyme